MRDTEDGFKVRYVGITNDPWRRKGEHERDERKTSEKNEGGEVTKVPWEMHVVVSGLTKKEARALEQSLICIYTIDALANARYEIAEKNYDNFEKEIERAAEITKIPLPDLKKAMKRKKD